LKVILVDVIKITFPTRSDAVGAKEISPLPKTTREEVNPKNKSQSDQNEKCFVFGSKNKGREYGKPNRAGVGKEDDRDC